MDFSSPLVARGQLQPTKLIITVGTRQKQNKEGSSSAYTCDLILRAEQHTNTTTAASSEREVNTTTQERQSREQTALPFINVLRDDQPTVAKTNGRAGQ